MARNFNRDISSNVTQYREQGDCKTRLVNASSYYRDGGQEYRSAPNGTAPYFFAPTFMAAAREIRGGNESFKEWQGSSQYVDDRWGAPINPVPNDFGLRRAEAREQARYQAYQKMYSNLTNLDISETVAQLKSVKQTVDIAETIGDLTRKAAGRFGITRVIANGWMWANFGVKPLVSDMFGILENTSRQVLKPFTISCGNTQPFRVSANVNGREATECKLTYRVSATFKSGAFDSLSNITSMDPAYIAWTALPWTFISDYFYNVGGYLRQLELNALYNTAFLHGCESAKVSGRGYVMSSFPRKTGWSCMDPYVQHHRSEINLEIYERGVLEGLPTPSPPQFNLDLGSSSLLNIAAVLGSFMSNGKPKRK